MAHDFRAPLTSIGGYCGLLLSGQLGALDGRQREVLQRMGQSAERLSRLASAVVDVAAGRNLRPALQLEEADIQGCVRQVLHEIAPIAASKQLQVSVALEPPATKLRFHRYKIEQVFQNLLENSCKFSPNVDASRLAGARRFTSGAFEPASRFRRSRTGVERIAAYPIVIAWRWKTTDPELFPNTSTPYRGEGGGGGMRERGAGWPNPMVPAREFHLFCHIRRALRRTQQQAWKLKEIKWGPTNPEVSCGSATVLVGEDEAEVRSYLEMALQCQGYTVELAEDGEEVLTYLNRPGPPVGRHPAGT